MNKKNALINLGCRLNIYEGEIIKNHINYNNLNDVTVINSCGVTAEAEKKVAYEIRKAKRDNPKNKIIVTGCAAQINPKKYNTIDEVDLVLGNKEKLLSNIWKNLNFLKPIQVEDILSEKKTVPSSIEKFDGKSRAYIEIQQGCDHRCTFCIIPYGRGNNRSVPAGEIVERIKKIVKNGYKEDVPTLDKEEFNKEWSKIIKLIDSHDKRISNSLDDAKVDLKDETVIIDLGETDNSYIKKTLNDNHDLIQKCIFDTIGHKFNIEINAEIKNEEDEKEHPLLNDIKTKFSGENTI